MKLVKSSLVIDLLKEWEDSSVIYCHWKSIDHLEEALCGVTDLDILIAVDHWMIAETIVVNSGFVLMETATLRRYPGVLDYIVYDSNNDCFIHLHLHYQLVLGDRWVKAYRLPVEAEVLSRRVRISRFDTWVVSPVDELLIFCVRMCVKHKRPFENRKIIGEAEYIVSRLECLEDLSLFENSYFGSTIALAMNLISCGCKSIKKHHVRTVSKDMGQYRRMSAPRFFFLSHFRFLYRLYVEFFRRKIKNFTFGRRRLMRGGLVVAFVGMDGSGKTSAVSRNSNFFAKQMDVENIFLGSGRSGAPWYRKIAFSLYGTKTRFKHHEENVQQSSQQIKKYPFCYLVWLWLVSCGRCSRLRKIFMAKSSNKLVFVDRWPQDSVVNTLDGPRLSSIGGNSFFLKLAKRIESKGINLATNFPPDIILRFNVEPETALIRKPDELTLQQAIQAKIDLMRIKWSTQSTVVDVNSNKSIEEVDRDIREAIWSKISG